MEWNVAEKELENLSPGELLLEGRRPKEALIFLEQGLRDEPGNFRLLNNTAVAYRQLGRFAEAEEVIRRAAKVRPNRPEPWHNLAHVLEEQGKFGEAEQYYVRAVSMGNGAETDQKSRYALAASLMQRYAFKEAWKFWDEGRAGTIFPILPGIPQWRGEDLTGKRIIVFREGGYGDIFLMLRYLGALKDRGAHVTYHSWKAQAPILRGHPWIDEIIDSEQMFELEAYDYQISIQSIMEFVEPCPLPMRQPYLWAECPKQFFPQPAVGLCWPAGEIVNPYRKYRSIPIECFARFPEIPVDWVSLQVSEPTPEWMLPTEKGWENTANVIAGLDLVISSNTSVCHLAAAMGKPTWLILQLNSEWFWFLGREDSPWYPNLRIFRSTDPLDFTEVVGRVFQELKVRYPGGK